MKERLKSLKLVVYSCLLLTISWLVLPVHAANEDKTAVQSKTSTVPQTIAKPSNANAVKKPVLSPGAISNTQVLIDVSGSMKQNDPNNIRIPSLRLLAGLLPNDSKAGVWNFGTTVNPIVATGISNDKWKVLAQQAANSIHSKDLFTNIGQALTEATKQWEEQDAKLADSKPKTVSLIKNNTTTKVKPKTEPKLITENRHIILLTDGMVDISGDDKKNLQERNKILKELLPELKKLNVKIHTIALSNNADKEFLSKLSTDTDGTYVPSESANDLERIFLHLYEKTTKQDTIPLIDNTFTVDDSVYELTLLIFKDKNAKKKASEIVLPSGERYKRSDHPSKVRWFSEKNYDLVTIQKPEVGEWLINASLDPDNRVMVVTNLKIETNRLPNNVFIGEQIKLDIFLSDQNEIISDDEFLQFTSLSVEKTRDEEDFGQPVKKWYLHDNGLRTDELEHDGIFNLKLGKNFIKGRNEYVIKAQSDTFARELRKSFYAHDIPLLLGHLTIREKNGKTIRRVTVVPNLEYVSPDKIKMSAKLINSFKEAKPIKLLGENSQQLEWFFETRDISQRESYTIVFNMKARTHRGRNIDYTSKPYKLNIDEIIRKLPSTTVTENTMKTQVASIDKSPKPEIKVKQEIKQEPAQVDEELPQESQANWGIAISLTILVNLIAGVAGWFFYRRWKNRETPDLINLTGEMG
ncbi:MAG: VWA domain-containing protein [Gammaproteobacteria bacterium]|nr:VWA domain-containing protein [Gammaproteobacteria bacterium]